jgi:hypothetical protein
VRVDELEREADEDVERPALVAQVLQIEDQMTGDVADRLVAERQAMWCDKIEIPDTVETNGVWGNTDPIPPRPEKCFYYKKDNGRHTNIQKGFACFAA